MRQAEVDENGQLDNGDEQERQRDAALHEQDDEEDRKDRHGIDDLEVVVGRFDHVLHARGLADEHTGRIIFLQNGIERIDLGIHFVACDLVLRIDEQQLPFVALENRADGIRQDLLRYTGADDGFETEDVFHAIHLLHIGDHAAHLLRRQGRVHEQHVR